MNIPALESQLHDLQERYAYLERLVEELNGVVASQGKLLDRVLSELRAMAERAQPQGGAQEPPPHY